MKHYRLSYTILFMLAIIILSITFIQEYVMHDEPCPLCIIQRILMMGLALIFLIASLHNPKKHGRAIYSTASFLVGIAGVLVASRQIYLQTLPMDKAPQCGADITYLIQALPITQVIKQIFIGTADCALIQWKFLGLSTAGWSLICFSLFSAITLLFVIVQRKN